MSFGKYFKRGQKVFITRISLDENKTLDTLTGYVTSTDNMWFDLTLPYGADAAESYPFAADMPFEVMTDHRGMGLRLQARFAERTKCNDIRLHFDGNLEFISRRMYRRVDVNAWFGCRRQEGNLAEMRKIWQDSIAMVEAGTDPRELTVFKRHPVNLSGGGLRIPVAAPANPAELLILFLSIGDKQGIICLLAEVVWAGAPSDDGTVLAGLRILNVRKNDQGRIDAVVQTCLKKLGKQG